MAPLRKQSECSAVGSALRSGRRGRAFESPHSDKIKGSFLEYSKLPFISIYSPGRNRDGYTKKTPTYYIMKNSIYLFTVAVTSFMCISCTKTQTTLSENEKAVNPPIMGWSSWNAFRVDISEDIIKIRLT